MNRTKPLFIYSWGLLILSFVAFSGDVDEDSLSTNKIALKGYDVITYREEGIPVKGKKSYFHQWKEMIWYFSKKENLAKFKDNPERYVPQYQGCCAVALANGKVVEGDPTIFKIHERKLFLFHNEKARDIWDDNPTTYIERADQGYIKLFSIKF